MFQLNGEQVTVAVGRDVTQREKQKKPWLKVKTGNRSLFENMLEGFLLAKIVVNNQGEPVNWMHIAINDIVRIITDFDDVIGKM